MNDAWPLFANDQPQIKFPESIKTLFDLLLRHDIHKS